MRFMVLWAIVCASASAALSIAACQHAPEHRADAHAAAAACPGFLALCDLDGCVCAYHAPEADDVPAVVTFDHALGCADGLELCDNAGACVCAHHGDVEASAR